MKRKKIYGIFMLVAIAVFLFAGGRILQIYLNYQESQKVYEQMEGFTQKTEDQDLSPEAVPGETPGEVAEQGFLQVDFNKLEEINPDVIAWIEIPGLEISYPVVQGRDNDYYLHHLITGENHKSGSIFMDFHNQEDLSDRNTIIYGHNMKDGSMFGTLDQYQSQALYRNYPYFYMYVPGYIYEYQIFSCYAAPTDYPAYTYDLLNIECGFYILDALKKFCAEKNIEFASGIITNGTLLTAEIVSQLINYNCQQIQITLDGMPDTHNARRKYKDGKGSFEQIISALELLNNKCADIHTVIRINVDKNNLDEVSSLLEYLGINGKGLTNCNVDFGIVRGSTQACSAYSGNCLSESIVGEVLSKLWSKAEMEGFTLYTKPFHRWIYCGLYADSQFTVTPNGELYKCWEHAGDEQHLMGNINENGNIDNIKYSYYDWMSHNPLENEECKECVYLPACGGGCGVVSYNETNSYHSKGCFKVKGVLEKQVLRYFKGKI